jgi:hypothetical protein
VSCSLRSNASRHIMPRSLTCVSSRRRGYARTCVWSLTAQALYSGPRESAMCQFLKCPARCNPSVAHIEAGALVRTVIRRPAPEARRPGRKCPDRGSIYSDDHSEVCRPYPSPTVDEPFRPGSYRSRLSLSSFRFRRRASLELELIALRHQLIVLRRQRPRLPRLHSADRLLRVCLY